MSKRNYEETDLFSLDNNFKSIINEENLIINNLIQDVNNINFNDQKKYSIDSLKLQITKQYLLLDKTTDWNEKKLIKNKINFLKREFNNYRFN